ncbi:hypothetical protein D4764_16G0010050 [Takifugu flavidus]|uniref:G-protein coupled receptors family 1 profile domain-containing protein n=1 Tax=Takifugu flavidus TaxID=433684 RepID=A0A5C6P081_9TELE|nr:hypothetical protein D4764_16G0010050 [Takifugu flavidus]
MSFRILVLGVRSRMMEARWTHNHKGQQVSLEGRLKVREELREQTGPANPQPPELESTVTPRNPQTRLHGHDWREALKENMSKKNLQQQLEGNQQLHQRAGGNGERLRRELSAETEKLKKELSDREEALKKELCEKEKVFLKTHQDLSELWEAELKSGPRERERELEEMLQNMEKQKVEELQLTTGDVEKEKRRIWRVWKMWRRLNKRLLIIPDRSSAATISSAEAQMTPASPRGDTRTVVPVILIGISVSGALGNLLVLLILARDFNAGKGSEVKALLASLASTDLAILLLCAPVRALTYYKQTWTLGAFVCSTTDWFQHSCVVAKTLILAATTRAKHTAGPRTARGPLSSPPDVDPRSPGVHRVVSMLLPTPQMLFATLAQRGGATVCVSQVPECASDFIACSGKVYPTAAFAVPVLATLGYYTQALHSARQQGKVTLVLLCLSAALGLMLLPEWGTFVWIRLGHNKPPVGLVIFAQVLLYACSSLSPRDPHDDVRRRAPGTGAGLGHRHLQRRATHAQGNKCPKAEGNAAEAGTGARGRGRAGARGRGQTRSPEPDKTIPDVEHFWTGRRNTQVEEEQDPIPWEKEEKML